MQKRKNIPELSTTYMIGANQRVIINLKICLKSPNFMDQVPISKFEFCIFFKNITNLELISNFASFDQYLHSIYKFYFSI